MKQHTLFWGSSYDRGLQHLLKMWPKILAKFPDAKLHICYGWDLFIAGYRDNPERMAWMERINLEMKQKGITHHGRVGKQELGKIRQECGIWTYPTDFQEINCITALECQNDGLVPVVMDYAALQESVQSGVKVTGDIYDRETQDEYLKQLLELMGDTKRWEKESFFAKEFARDFSWGKISKDWVKYFI